MKFISKARKRDERGATLIVLAISLTAIMAMIGVALDGSVAFGARRQMQNAADAAALAGADQFSQYLLDPLNVDPLTVWTTVQDIAAINGAEPGDIECVWIPDGGLGSDGTDLGPCSNTNPAIVNQAAGIKVYASVVNDTTFSRVMGQTEIASNADATAMVQSLEINRIGQNVPFLVCGQNSSDGPDMVLQDAAGEWYVNPAAYNIEYQIHGPHVNKCNQGGGPSDESFKGKAAPNNATNTIPGIWNSDNGVKAGPVRQDLRNVNGCSGEDTFDGCYMVLPLCVQRVTKTTLECVTIGTFEVRSGKLPSYGGSSSNSHVGRLVSIDPGLPLEGIGGWKPVSPSEPRVVRLTD